MAQQTVKQKDDILLEIEEKLKEEKWTRATVESYSVRNFVELDSYIRLAIDDQFKDELRQLCKDYIKSSQNSIVGLYVIGVLSLEESSIDDTHIPQIIKLFLENKKYKIAEFLAEKILSYRENKFALKTLESIYEEQSDQDELFNVKKRLVLIDSKDAANAKFLGEYYEKEGDKDIAMFYYRLAIERFIKSRSVKMVEELWNRIIKLFPDDMNLLIGIARKIREVMGDMKVADMAFSDIVKPQMRDGKFQNALTVLKLIIDFKSDDKGIRKAIEECYRNLFAEHSQLDKYLKASAIGQTWKPHREAMRNFESHIAFDTGRYISHKTWGIGLVKDIQNEMVTIDFEKKKDHKMSLQIALRALTVLDNEHINIWKKFRHDELKAMLTDDPLKVLTLILKSNDGTIAAKDVKTILVPDVLTEKEWIRWWTTAKAEIEQSNNVVHSLTVRGALELRETDETVSDELIRKFKKTTNFENKVKVFIDFVVRGGDINLPGASALVSYFNEIINASSESPERKLISHIVLKFAVVESHKDSDIDVSILFGIKNIVGLYESIDQETKRSFLDIIRNKLKDWEDRYADFILQSTITKMHNYILKELVTYEKYDILNRIVMTAMNNYQEKPELFSWVARLLIEDEYPSLKEHVGIKDSEIIYRLLSLIDILTNEVEAKTNVGMNKKVIGQVYDILWKKKALDNYIISADETQSNAILSLIYSANNMLDSIKKEYIDKILAKYPNLEQAAGQEKVMIRHPFMVTRLSYEAKKRELQRIMNEEIPQNSASIGEAMEKGDLRENAEYKAALEKQDQLKAAASKLEAELTQAKILERDKVDTSIVDAGTRVKLQTQDGGTEEYQILGQWEVDFEKGIISYHSPLGRALLDKKVGKEVNFEFNGQMKKYTILDIKMADFE
jgi:transcription elongation factor GreA